MDFNTLNHNVQGRKDRKRIGRGNGSGWGSTAGRGHKGQKARAGYSRRPTFEGGQMPLFRKIPKRGFNNAIFKKIFVPINIEMLKNFPADSIITIEDFKNSGIVKDYLEGIKILGTGDIDKKLTITAHRFSKSARDKIEKAGGKCIELMPVVAKEPKKDSKKKHHPKVKKDEADDEEKSDTSEVKKNPDKDAHAKSDEGKTKPKKDDKKK